MKLEIGAQVEIEGEVFYVSYFKREFGLNGQSIVVGLCDESIMADASLDKVSQENQRQVIRKQLGLLDDTADGMRKLVKEALDEYGEENTKP